MRTLFIPLCCFLLLCAGCKKTGPEGATGATGPAGAVGPAGANGTMIYSGTTVPAATLGNVGDFYMDLATSTLYGPKTSSGWGTGFSLKGATGDSGAAGTNGANGINGTNGTNGANGATGAAGKAGTQIYAGSGSPAASLGTTGDFYMDTVAHNLYGPKLASGWGVPIALQGPAGATGATGPQGPAGTANVLYTPWDTLGGWTLVSGYGGQNIVEHYEIIPAITSAIYEGGTVICYGDLEDYITQIWPAGQEAPLPITVVFRLNGTQATDTWEMTFNTGSSTIDVYDTNNNFNQYSFTTSRVRWVIIPPGAAIPADVQQQIQQSRGRFLR